MPFGHKSCSFNENFGRFAKRRQCVFGFGDQLLQSRPRSGCAKYADNRRLARHGVLAGLFADQRRVAFEVEKIVGDLERLADRRESPATVLK